MKHDFRYYTFNSLFSTDSYTDNILLVENDLSENQLLRAQQLLTFLNENVEQIVLKIDNLFIFITICSTFSFKKVINCCALSS